MQKMTVEFILALSCGSAETVMSPFLPFCPLILFPFPFFILFVDKPTFLLSLTTFPVSFSGGSRCVKPSRFTLVMFECCSVFVCEANLKLYTRR